MTPKFLRTSLAIVGAAVALAAAPAAVAAPFTVTINDNGACTGTWQTTGTASGTTVTCTSSTPPPAGAPTCTVSSPVTISSGATANLSLTNCSVTGGGTITYEWHVGSPSGTLVTTNSAFSTGPLTSSTTYYGIATANALSTTYQTTVTVNTPPPTTGTCTCFSSINLGDLQFNGVQLDSSGMRGSTVAYGRIQIPDPLPTGWIGKTASVAVLANGNATAWRKIYLSKTPCTFTASAPAMSQGVTVTVNMSFGAINPNAVTVHAGETWYLNIKDELPFGGNSCGTGYVCDFGLRMYPPWN